MIDSLVNLIFRCSHRHLSRPLTNAGKAGVRSSESYVVCLDCGRHFAYDVEQMRIGKAIVEGRREQGTSRRNGLKLAMWAAVPLALAAAIGAKWRFGKPASGESAGAGNGGVETGQAR